MQIDAPVFKSFPPPYTLASLGDPLVLSCDVDSNPPANILWTKNGEFIGGGSQYLIPEVHENDYAVYACIATLGGQFTKIVASTKVVSPGICEVAHKDFFLLIQYILKDHHVFILHKQFLLRPVQKLCLNVN